MLPKKFRITKKTDFQRVLKSGQFFQGMLASVVAWRQEGVSRFGVIVSNKVSKKATGRNKLKRIVRRFIQEKQDCLQDGRMVVVLIKRNALEKGKDEVTNELTHLFKQAGIFIK